MSTTLEKLETRIENDTLISLGHLIAGGSAGSIALAILYPIEQLNTRKTVGEQSTARIITIRTIIDDFIHLRIENIFDIYRGLQFGIFEKFMFNGIYFFFYSFLKNNWKNRYSTIENPREMPMTVALFRGSIAGILTQIFTSPLATIQKVLQTTNSQDKMNSNASMIINNVSQRHGITALWSGFGMSMILVINPAINVYCYEHIRKYLNVSFGWRSSAIDFLAGLLSKAIATIICYPLIYIKYNQQADSTGDRKKSAMEIVLQTYNQFGVKKFYSGLRSKLIQSSLNNALMFMIKEKIVIYTFAMMLYIVNKRKQLQGVTTRQIQ
eukprot:149460_1